MVLAEDENPTLIANNLVQEDPNDYEFNYKTPDETNKNLNFKTQGQKNINSSMIIINNNININNYIEKGNSNISPEENFPDFNLNYLKKEENKKKIYDDLILSKNFSDNFAEKKFFNKKNKINLNEKNSNLNNSYELKKDKYEKIQKENYKNYKNFLLCSYDGINYEEKYDKFQLNERNNRINNNYCKNEKVINVNHEKNKKSFNRPRSYYRKDLDEKNYFKDLNVYKNEGFSRHTNIKY